MRNIYDSISKANADKRISNQAGAHAEMARSNYRSAAFRREPWYLTAARKEKERLAKLESEKKGD